MIVRVKVTDHDRYAKYRQAVLPLIESFGGKRIPGDQAELLEGDQNGNRIVLFAFPNIDAIRAFWNSPAYAPVKELRRDAAVLEIWAVPSDD